MLSRRQKLKAWTLHAQHNSPDGMVQSEGECGGKQQLKRRRRVETGLHLSLLRQRSTRHRTQTAWTLHAGKLETMQAPEMVREEGAEGAEGAIQLKIQQTNKAGGR
jgi:hypothetical protein